MCLGLQQLQDSFFTEGCENRCVDDLDESVEALGKERIHLVKEKQTPH